MTDKSKPRIEKLELNKETVQDLTESEAAVRSFLSENVALFNGKPGDPRSFDLLDDLLNQHLLASLVVRHLYLFPVPQNVKDELCRKLGIAVEKLDRAEAAFGEHTKRIGPK